MTNCKIRTTTTAAALIVGCLWGTALPAQQVPEVHDPAKVLEQLAEEYAAHREAQDELPPDVTVEGLEKRVAFARSILDRLGKLPAAELAHQQWLTAEILRWEASNGVEARDLYWYRSPITPYSSLRWVRAHLPNQAFDEDEDLESHLDSLRRFPAYFEAIQAKLKAQRERGFILAAEQTDRALPFLRSFQAPPEESDFWVADRRLQAFPDEKRKAFQAQVAKLIEDGINPAVEAAARYVKTELRPHAPETVGLAQYPGGPDAYRAMVRSWTTLGASPGEIHGIGLEAVERTNRQMKEVRDVLGFEGSKAEFHERLLRDPRHHAQTPEEVGERLMAPIERLRPHVDKLFAVKPQAPFAVRRLAEKLEGSLTYGFYDPPNDAESHGIYYFNGSKLDERPLLTAAALIYHELVPGHHFQVSLARENDELSEFRRKSYYGGYSEGWAEYASKVVARELGMYEGDPYDLYGLLVSSMFFSVRLVVDTGMNARGWSRQQAIDFMRDNTLESDVQIGTETLRYLDRPGQALAYGMGVKAWTDVRARAKRELSERFDLRRFHSAVLSTGDLPLLLLERHVEWFIKEEKRGKP